mmetsp:Transcript_11362/g.17874  ORF Transcript_11362/g.17874 Transcript_11362/m.17874 type:complete len:314 (-) Transcript_11362:405-1346(-)
MSMLDSVKHAVHTVFKESVETVMPVSTVSQFREKGVLTPGEFVAAGDMLVAKCPSWQWEGGDASKAKEYLPKDKQYLVTRNVPCTRRAAGLEMSVEERALDDGEDEEWTDTRGLAPSSSPAAGAPDEVEDIDGPAPIAGNSVPESGAAQATVSAGAEEDVPDLDDLELEDEALVQDDPSAVQMRTVGTAAGGSGGGADDFVKARSYTVSISYDKYYQTPRVWLFGYSEDGAPLSHEQVFEDMSKDHAKKTITIDPHPHLANISHASVHPCRWNTHLDAPTSCAALALASRPCCFLHTQLKEISHKIFLNEGQG